MCFVLSHAQTVTHKFYVSIITDSYFILSLHLDIFLCYSYIFLLFPFCVSVCHIAKASAKVFHSGLSMATLPQVLSFFSFSWVPLCDYFTPFIFSSNHVSCPSIFVSLFWKLCSGSWSSSWWCYSLLYLFSLSLSYWPWKGSMAC